MKAKTDLHSTNQSQFRKRRRSQRITDLHERKSEVKTCPEKNTGTDSQGCETPKKEVETIEDKEVSRLRTKKVSLTNRPILEDSHSDSEYTYDCSLKRKRQKKLGRKPVTPSPLHLRQSNPSGFNSLTVEIDSPYSLRSTRITPSSSRSFTSSDSRTVPAGVYNIDSSFLQKHCCCDSYCEAHCSPNMTNKTYLQSYGKAYFTQLLNSEVGTPPRLKYCGHSRPTDYLKNQPNLSERMRSILVDWLIEVVDEYNLGSLTLHLGVRLVDRVLCIGFKRLFASDSESSSSSDVSSSDFSKSASDFSKCFSDFSKSDSSFSGSISSNLSNLKEESGSGGGFIVPQNMLQCVGCACMLLASKIEEIHAPATTDFVFISDNTYSVKDVVKMERCICAALSYDLQCVTTYHFMHRFMRASIGNGQPFKTLEYLISYLLELALLQYELVSERCSLIAASAVYLARVTLGLGYWTKTLEYYTGYTLRDMKKIVKCLHKAANSAEDNACQSIFVKYKHSKYGRVALRTVPREVDLKLS